MPDQHVADITELATLGEQLPLRLMQLGFRLMQAMDEQGHDAYQYVIPPVCEVPAGPFLMGSDKSRDPQAQDNELPQHVVTLAAYCIGTYPLTVAEYACFVHATQWSEPQRRSQFGNNLPWHTQLSDRWDHPVVNVSWQDVLAYVQWLAQVTGESWRLPTEAEWEKAARGTDGRLYPWGDHWDATRANTDDGGPGKSTPVGAYASNDDISPYGVHDMAGNVWEWTSSAYWAYWEREGYSRTHRNYPYDPTDGRENLESEETRMSRGGSWAFVSLQARAASRGDFGIDPFGDDRGARLVRGCP